MATKRKSTAKQRAAQKAWVERRDARERSEAWRRGDPGSGAVPLDGETSWSLAPKPGKAFETVVADAKAISGVTFPRGHVDSQAIVGMPTRVIVNRRPDGTYVTVEPR